MKGTLKGCNAKHAKYQPTDEEFVCPTCGHGPLNNGLVIDETQDDANDDCPMLHEGDSLRCYECGYETSGKAFSKKCQTKANMIPCPHCKGKGFVKNEGEK